MTMSAFRNAYYLRIISLIYLSLTSTDLFAGNFDSEMRAQFTARRFTTLSSEISAKVNLIAAKEGDRFVAGQLLIKFDCSLQSAQKDRAMAQLDAAENILAGNRRLAELDSIGQVELRNAEAEVKKANAEVAYNLAILEKCEIHAPYSGRVAEQKAREQQFVQPGQPLMDILDDSSLELEFIVPSKWLESLKVGGALKVRVDDTGKTYLAKVIRLGARADPVSQTIKVIALVDGQHPELIAGMSGVIMMGFKGR